MAVTFEDLRVLKSAEEVADSVWNIVVQWDEFAKDVVGKQLTRAVDSIGANISESFGRYHFGEKLQILYQETKQSKTLREMAAEYQVEVPGISSDMLFEDDDINWLRS